MYLENEIEKGVIYVVIVCHAESDPWDCGNFGLRFGLPAIVRTFKKVEVATGIKIPTTFCVNPPTAEFRHFGAMYHSLLKEGHEVGLHSQGGTEFFGQHHEDLGPQDNERRILFDVKKLSSLGFSQIRTYAPGNFSYIASTTHVLEDAGIEVSCSALPGSYEKEGYDYRMLKEFKPYHPSYEDNSIPGNSHLVEIPVSARLRDLERDKELIMDQLQTRLNNVKKTGGIDIFQIVWHPWELVNQAGEININYIKSVEEFLLEVAALEGIKFDIVYNAAKKWRNFLLYE